MEFQDEQLRQSENLTMAYEAWVGNERVLIEHTDRLSWKTINGTEYLYAIRDRLGNGKSLGPKTDERIAWAEQYTQTRNRAKAERPSLTARLEEVARLCRALRMPALDSTTGRILRRADATHLLGSVLMTVGTNAMLAYAYYARRLLPPDIASTQDFDMAWCGQRSSEALAIMDAPPGPVMALLKGVDDTFTVNTERPFQARNARAFEVELLVAPSRAATLPRTESLRPVPTMPEQEWLLLGEPVSEVVLTRDAKAARVVVPDPRWYALQKLWLAQKPTRNPKKQPKDQRQGALLWELALEGAFPFHPIDDEFVQSVPEELKTIVPPAGFGPA